MKYDGCPYDQKLGHQGVASSPPHQQFRQGQMTQQLAHQGHQQGQQGIASSPPHQQFRQGQMSQQLAHQGHQQGQQASQQPHQQLSRQSQTVSGGSSTPPTSSGEPRKISCEDIQQVQNLIERCLQLYMNQKEVVNTLLNQAKIEPGFTGLVWQKLEEQNPDFFRAYYTRLIVKQQITKFNELLRQQVELIQRSSTTNASSPSIANGLHPSPIKHTPIGYPGQQQAIPSQRIHNMGCNLVPSNPTLINGASCLPNAVRTNDNSISSGRMEIATDVAVVLPGHSGISQGNELAIQSASAFSNNSNFPFNAVGTPTDIRNTVMSVSVADFNSHETHPQSAVGSFQDADACQKDTLGFLGHIPRNFSLSDLTADFSHASDILGSYSGYPFVTQDGEAFLHSPEKECLDDGRMLGSISETLSYDEFGSDG